MVDQVDVGWMQPKSERRKRTLQDGLIVMTAAHAMQVRALTGI